MLSTSNSTPPLSDNPVSNSASNLEFEPQSNSAEILLPVQDSEFLPAISHLAQLTGLAIVGVIGIAFFLASVINYKVIVKGQASVRPTGELRVVQSAIEGNVVDIRVTENQQIQKGDTIAILDDSQLQTQKAQLQQSIRFSQLQLIQISAQVQTLNSQIVAEKKRMEHSIVSAQAALEHRHRQYQDSQVVIQTNVEEAIANLRSAKVAFEAAKVKWARYEPIAETGAISTEQLEEVKLAAEQRRQAVEVAAAKLQQAQIAVNPSPAEVMIATAHIDQEKAVGAAAIANLQKEQESLIQQQLQIHNQLNQDSRTLENLESDLKKTTITATADGIISSLNLRNPGQNVRTGENIARIAPSNTDLVVKAMIVAQDIGKVDVGQKVQLRISACPYPDYGTLSGTVSSISPDAISSQGNAINSISSSIRTNTNGKSASAFYEVKIELDRLTLRQDSHECHIQLGMEGRADIISREETVLKFLLRKARLVTDF